MYIYIIICTEPSVQLIFAVCAPKHCTVKYTAVLEAVRKSADINSASFSEFVYCHLYFFFFLHKDRCTRKSINILLAFSEIYFFRIFQNEVFMLIPVVFVVSECEARFFLYTEYVSKLEEMSLILMTGRFADTDNSSAVVNESADRFDDLRVFPPFSSCMRRICIPRH